VDRVLAVVTDLYFQARISAAARAAGRPVVFVTSIAQLGGRSGPGLALVDLDAGLDVAQTIAELRAAGADPIIAFGPHLDTNRRKAARAAGASRVLAKSKFVNELPLILRPNSSPDHQ
jgi:CheY-like chemotaxis protein